MMDARRDARLRATEAKASAEAVNDQLKRMAQEPPALKRASGVGGRGAGMGMGIMKVRDREDAGFLRHLPSSVLG